MKKVIFIAIAFLIGIGGYFGYQKSQHKVSFHHVVKEGLGFEKWTVVAPKEENFTASFPEKPKAITRDLPVPGRDETLPYKEYICETEGGKKFSVSYTILPDGWLKYGKNLVLGGALKVIMKELGKVELVGKETTVFKTFPALDYEHYNDSMETAGTLVLVGNILYKVEMSYPMELHDKVQDELANFIANFSPAFAPQPENSEPDTPQFQ